MWLVVPGLSVSSPRAGRPWGRACADQTHRSRASIVNLLGIIGWWECVTTSWREGRAPAGPRKAASVPASAGCRKSFWVEQMLPEGSPPRDARDEPRPGFWVSLSSSVGTHPPRAPRKPPRGRATSSSHRVEVGPSRKSWSFSQDCLPSVDLGPDHGNSYVVSGSSSEGPQPGVSLGGMEGLGG